MSLLTSPLKVQSPTHFDTIQRLMDNVRQAVVIDHERLELILAALLARGHLLIGRRTGHRQDARRKGAGPLCRGHIQAYPVYARPLAKRHHRQRDLQPTRPTLRIHTRADI